MKAQNCIKYLKIEYPPTKGRNADELLVTGEDTLEPLLLKE